MDPISILLAMVLSISVIGTEVLMFFLVFRALSRVFRSRLVETLNDAGKPLVDPMLAFVGGRLSTVKKLREPPLLALSLLSVSILRAVIAWLLVQL